MKEYYSISEMADIHNISRQTLIHYDKIGLFKPIRTDEENNYRYYSAIQIPILREIYFLKSIGVKLSDIKKHMNQRNLDSAISLLEDHKDYVSKELERLSKIYSHIDQKLDIFYKADYYAKKINVPRIKELPEREAVFTPFGEELNKHELHITMMKSWKKFIENSLLPSRGFGTVIKKNQLKKADLFSGAGVFIVLPMVKGIEIQDKITMPAGKYVCMYKYGMPYHVKYIDTLLEWIEAHNYRVSGDIVDVCLLDTTFYTEDTNVDLCELQIPIESKYV